MGVLTFFRHPRHEDGLQKWALVDLVKAYMHAINHHAEVDDLMLFCTSEQVKIRFEDGVKVRAKDYFQTLYASFPDIQWKCSAIRRFSKNQVVVEDIRAYGTHTGKPFRFKRRPELPASGRRFQNDAALAYFTFVDQKIDKVEVVALGNKSGPLGIYDDLSQP